MIDRFEVTIGEGSIFTFRNIDFNKDVKSVRLGNDDNVFEMDMSYLDNTIQSGICVFCTNIKEKSIILPSYTSLEKTYATPYFSGSKMEYDLYPKFRIIFDNKELNVLLDNPNKIKAYTESNRIVFYYDNDFNLINIRIKNLTPQEYKYLKREKVQPGFYMIKDSYEKQLSKEHFNVDKSTNSKDLLDKNPLKTEKSNNYKEQIEKDYHYNDLYDNIYVNEENKARVK